MVDLGDLELGGCGEALGGGAFGLDAGLLGLEDLLGDAVFVVEVQQLLLLGDQFADTAGVPLGVVAGGCCAGAGVAQERRSDRFLLCGREQEVLVLALDCSFYGVCAEVWG